MSDKIYISFCLWLLVISISNIYAQEKKVCITVDDLPTVHYNVEGYDFRLGITDSLIKVFVTEQVPAIGFINEKKLYHKNKLETAQVHLLELWLKNGLELGNHTFSHFNYHKVDFEKFSKDVLKGELITKPLSEKYGMDYKFFRHPFLKIGDNKAKADSLKQFLESHGYIEAPVTIDNDDYLFAFAYSKAYKKGEIDLMKRIGRDYILYMEKKLLYFEEQSKKLFNRQISQILLIHASFLNANYIGELIGIYRKHGYTFISQEEALKDTTYQEPVTKFGDWGISWIDRWALGKGKKGDFFKDDPAVPHYITELTK